MPAGVTLTKLSGLDRSKVTGVFVSLPAFPAETSEQSHDNIYFPVALDDFWDAVDMNAERRGDLEIAVYYHYKKGTVFLISSAIATMDLLRKYPVEGTVAGRYFEKLAQGEF